MRFPPQILDEIRARLPVSQIVGRKVALKKKGRDFWGLSPFKSEKTPSFSVNDIKGFYHCFATQEHGDIFTFLIKTEGVSFPEAVERLAAEAGVSLPKQHPVSPERESEHERLLSIMAKSAEFFIRQLGTAQGQAVRDYLAGRQIHNETIAVFGLGYAADSYHALKDFLSDAGFSESEMIRSGMIIGGQDIRRSYDRFRHRVVFPIHDLKGRIIAFGGRALRPDDPAKYLNSPETPLFHKGRLLYNAHRAREPAFRTGEVIAVEGYMDAIALAQAGHAQTVAPLGTALTAEQLQMLWRMASEPVMCFDGDAAGRKAAYRALDTALPFLKPGYSLRFAFLPDGLDPDDLIRQQGASAIRSVIDQAQTLADVLWQREWDAGDWSTPERRAALEANLRALVGQIEDPDVKSHYNRMLLRDKLYNAWRSRLRDSKKFTQQRQHIAPRPEHASRLQSDPLIMGEGHNFNREASLIRALINHPWLLIDFAETVADLNFSFDALQRLQDALLNLLNEELALDTISIRQHLQIVGLQKDVELVDRSATHKCDLFAEPYTEDAEVKMGWHIAVLPYHIEALRKNVEAAYEEFYATQNDDAASRIEELQRQISILEASRQQLAD